MSLPPLPDAELSPPWHEWFERLKEQFDALAAASEGDGGLATLTERIVELEATAQAVIDDPYPIGCIATFVFNEAETVPATGGTYDGSKLTHPVLTFATASSTVATRAAGSPDGTWELVGPPSTDLDLTSATLVGSFNFKRIS